MSQLLLLLMATVKNLWSKKAGELKAMLRKNIVFLFLKKIFFNDVTLLSLDIRLKLRELLKSIMEISCRTFQYANSSIVSLYIWILYIWEGSFVVYLAEDAII